MRYIAFLRAINVGGNNVVKMDRLRKLFEGEGYTNVETFIASGNVIFDGAGKTDVLERAIEAMLKDALGFEVSTFVRTGAELRALAAHDAFTPSAVARATGFNVAFLGQPLDAKGKKALMALKTGLDDFHVHGREIYWLSQVRQGQSVISNAVFEKTLGRRSTVRGISTVRKMAEKYGTSATSGEPIE
jgi:uncharacterized protein (DUF1697 family)